MSTLRRILFLIFAAVLLLIFSRALLNPGMFFIHDNTQVGRISEMRLALEAGQFPVAWTQNFGFGYGMPLFLFYGPLPFYLGVIATWAGWSDIGAMKLLFGLSGVLAFGGVFAWFQRRGWSVAFPAALIVLAAPYRAVDIYIRGALNEVLAIGLLPWILVGAYVVRRSPKHGMALTAATVAAMLLTHNLTALIGLPLLGGLGVLWLWLYAEKPWQKIGWYAAGSILGLVMAAFYVVPSLVEQSATSIGAILTGYFDFRIHFLYIRQIVFERWAYGGSEYGPNDGLSFHLGVPVWLAIIGSITVVARKIWSVRVASSNKTLGETIARIFTREIIWTIALLVTLGISVIMTLSHTEPIWAALPLLQRVQFPWRFLGVSCVLAGLLAGQLLVSIPKKHHRWILGLLFMILALWQAQFHQPEKYIERPTGLYSSNPEVIRRQTSFTLPDFIPAGFDQELKPIASEDRIQLNNQSLRPDFNHPHRIRLFVDNGIPGRIEWNIAHFAGWKYYVDDQEVQPEIGGDGRAILEIKTTPVTIGAEFSPTPLRAQTQWLSLAAFIVWLSLVVPWKSTQRPGKVPHVSHK